MQSRVRSDRSLRRGAGEVEVIAMGVVSHAPNKWLERTWLRRHGSCVVWLATAPPPPLAAQPRR